MNLADWMVQERYNDRTLAEALENKYEIACSKQAVETWRNGKKLPRRSSLAALCDFTNGEVGPEDFGLAPEYLSADDLPALREAA